MLVHNRYLEKGGEDGVFEAEKRMLQKYDHVVEEYLDSNQRIINRNRIALGINTLWSFETNRKFTQLLKSKKPSVVHFHNTFPLISPSAYYACRKLRIPVVQTLHNYRLLCPGATLFDGNQICMKCLGVGSHPHAILNACYRNSRAQTFVTSAMIVLHRLIGTWKHRVNIYIALTEYAKKMFVKAGLPGERIIIKPNFVHPDPGVSDGVENFALYIGRLSREKGLETLFATWSYLKNIPLKIAGSGPLENHLLMVKKKNRLDRIEFLGEVPAYKVFSLIKKARFLVLPSECDEMFPTVILEAFACGVPVIASRLGSISEILNDGTTGLLFHPGDPVDLAEKVKWAWKHPGSMKKMGQKAREEYLAKYTPERNYQILKQIYQMALKYAQ